MKKLLLLILLSTFSFFIFSQESTDATDITDVVDRIEDNTDTQNIKGEEYHEAENFLDFIHSLDLVMQFEPGMYFNFHKTNAEGKLVSAPSPILFPISIGILWPNYTFIATQPTLSFFTMEHLFYENMALPAEIENRTTTTLSFMLNIPVVFSLFIKQSRVQLSAGIGTLLQFGLLSAGVSTGDYGYSGSAGSDVTLINEYFWKDMHWFYLTLGASWLYNINSQLRVGPTFNAYLPIGSLIGSQDFQGLMISLGVKICR